MTEPQRIDLEQNEADILKAAAIIYAGYLKTTPDTEDTELLNKAVDKAIMMAKLIDTKVSTGSEVKSKLGNSTVYKPLG